MTAMTESTSTTGQPADDRRSNAKLRSLFDTAYSMVEPFFDPDQGWGGHSLEHLAFRVLRENFSDLSSEEVHTIIVVAHRVYIEKNPGRSGHLRRPGELRPQNL